MTVINDIAISARNVSKRYDVFDSGRARLLNTFWPKHRAGLKEVWALRDIDFEIKRGESVAIIGRNGGGKSTLLEILTGTLAPTMGDIKVNGRVSALLELGSGFNPEYTGRENVMLNGLLLGLSREEILRRFDEVLAFSEIGDAVERPVKTYSSGMMMRLAFAVQVLTDPDILIIDEALSVGDFFFQQKCFGYIRSLSARGVTLLFVSHDMGTVRDLCSRAIYLNEGRVQFAGETYLAIRHYLAATHSGVSTPAPVDESAGSLESDDMRAIVRDSFWVAPSRQGDDGAARLIAVALYDADGKPATSFRLGSLMRLKVAYSPGRHPQAQVAIVLWNKFSHLVTSVSSSGLGLAAPTVPVDRALVFELTLGMHLEAGNYSLMVSLGQPVGPNQGSNLDSSPMLGPLSVAWDYGQEKAPFLGMVGLPAQALFRALKVDEEEQHV